MNLRNICFCFKFTSSQIWCSISLFVFKLLEDLFINKILTFQKAFEFLFIKSKTLLLNAYFLSSRTILSYLVASSQDSSIFEYSSLRYLCFFFNLLYLTLIFSCYLLVLYFLSYSFFTIEGFSFLASTLVFYISFVFSSFGCSLVVGTVLSSLPSFVIGWL